MQHYSIKKKLLAIVLKDFWSSTPHNFFSPILSLCEATATHYSEMMAICYPNPQSQCYINSDPLLSKAEDWAAVDLNAFSLI